MAIANLEELSGLTSAKRALRGVASGSPAHAVLLYGAEGSGKTTLANWLAKSWLCEHPSAEGGCGACKPCLAFSRNSNADVLFVAPRGKSHMIKLGQITFRKEDDDEPPPIPIQDFLRTGPLQSAHKVVIMRDVHRMSNEAPHAFLKTLEEPEPFARFVLMTTEVRRVKETILSRCLCLACELPDGQSLAGLQGGLAPWVLALGGESPGISKRLLESADVYEPFFRFADALGSMPEGAALKAAEGFRALCEALSERHELSARNANVEGLKLLATALKNLGWPPEKAQAVVQTHAKVVQNASMPIASDALFANLLA